ncbi:IS5 family transposase [Corallococcus sp. AB030]|nr:MULTISPECIES: IS5 family transposase [Corallococcus]RKI19810.1 IS5 family transposase [Corallococcus sp. AB030]RUO93439.1 IS5 family transposase [Corallococcus sp. AB018]
MGRSRGGFSSKVHALCTTQGQPLEVTLTPGQRGDVTEAEHLIQYAHGKALIADAGYDADHLVQAVRERGMRPVIAMNPTRKHHRRRNSRALYRLRIQVECMFHRLKRFRAVATRYEKTATNYLAVLHLACMMLWLN